MPSNGSLPVCQKCFEPTPKHDLYTCGRCKRDVCPGCLDPHRVSLCKECACIERAEEIERRLHEQYGT